MDPAKIQMPLGETHSLCTTIRSVIWKGKGLWFWHLIDKNNMLSISNCAGMLIFRFFRKKKRIFFFLKGKTNQLFSDLLKEITVFPIITRYFMGLGYLLTHKISVWT